MAFTSLAQLVGYFENRSGNPTALNYAYDPTHTASGLYQFTNSTWQQYGSQIGLNLSQYPTAASAPSDVQNAVFAQAVAVNGLRDWTCPGCNTQLTNYVAQNPDVQNLPVLGDGTVGGGTATQSGSQTSPDTSAASNVSGCTSWVFTPVACVTATLTELAYIFLALIVIAAGVYWWSKK